MHKSDVYHPNFILQQKLNYIYSLRKGSKINWNRGQYLNLLHDLGDEHKKLPPVIHVAGTNGKGSIVAILKSILEEEGYKVHSYTSPHLIKVNERINVAGKNISDKELEELIDELWPLIEGQSYSFFEILTAIAFRVFSRRPADVLLLEVGCGGRLDCTNVVDRPLATIISRISLDHTEFLGTTCSEIAAEKAGIMKEGSPCVIGYQGTGSQKEEIIKSLNLMASKSDSPLFLYGKDWFCEQYNNNNMKFSFDGSEKILPLPTLIGKHQIWNAGAALAALRCVNEKMPVTWESISSGLKSVYWPARMQQVKFCDINMDESIEIWLDSGHNDSAGEVIAEQISAWQKVDNRPIHAIVGMLSSKDVNAFLGPFHTLVKSIRIVPIPNEEKTIGFNEINRSIIPNASWFTDYKSAVKDIVNNSLSCRILIAGSTYLAGSILKDLK